MKLLLGGVPLGCDNIGDEAIIACVVKLIRSLVNDAATLDVWEADFTDITNLHMQKLYENLKAGEPFMLPDGSYIAALNAKELREKNLTGIDLSDPDDTNALESGVHPDDFMLRTDVIRFTVKDGNPVRDLMFFVRDYDPALDAPVEIPETTEAKDILPDMDA